MRLKITGTVQGVGFRPCVYNIAHSLALTGFVRNDERGVTIEVQGQNCKSFLSMLKENLPPLAVIDFIESCEVPLIADEKEFVILPSESSAEVVAKISPDVGVCKDCLRELFDPQNRFYQYPFLNCTNCGPRLTITNDLPYDREKTSMKDFVMCDDCKSEYSDPQNRRYHAQPIACGKCGPKLSTSISEIASRIKSGDIVAVKGVGGYQLICDATNAQTVEKLRERKARDTKPFAIMILNAASAKDFVYISEDEKKLLESWQRPIVLLKRRDNCLPDSISSGLSEHGVMLPYTPIHYLIFHALLDYPSGHDWLDQSSHLVLIATSANLGGEPLIIDDEEACLKLCPLSHDAESSLSCDAQSPSSCDAQSPSSCGLTAGSSKNKKLRWIPRSSRGMTKPDSRGMTIADYVVSYNRKILTRADDSVMRIVDHQPYFIRRARGFVPTCIKLAKKIAPGIALGAHLKNSICITRGDEAFVSQYLGDMDNPATIEFFHETLEHLLKILNVKPEFIAHDVHPDFYTTQVAQDFNLPTFSVQHHHAHLLSVAAEHHITEPALGLALDGYGYGEQGESWGGELMLLEGINYQRLGHLKNMLQPGGDIAAREPWRMAVSFLYQINSDIKKHFDGADALIKFLNSNHAIPATSSCGRLFDMASSLLDVCHVNRYEGEAAMRLESLVTETKVLKDGWAIENNQLNLFPLLQHLLTVDPIEGANVFHGTLIAALTDWIVQNAKQYQIRDILLSGGCFLNKILAEGLVSNLREKNLNPLLPHKLPPNDGGISLGQVIIAGKHISE